MDYDYLKLVVEELGDKHPDKLLYAIDHPEFICWFVGRVISEFGKRVDVNVLTDVCRELVGLNGRQQAKI